MRTKILAVGKMINAEGIKNDNFESAASFSDYDVLIIDPRNILPKLYRGPSRFNPDGKYHTDGRFDHGHGMGLISLFAKRISEIGRLLNISQGLVICYLRKKEAELVVQTHGGMTALDNYSWLPECPIIYEGMRTPSSVSLSSLLRFADTEGVELSSLNHRHPFVQWFRAFKGAIRFECVINIHKDLVRKTHILARNKVNEIIACEIKVEGGRMIFLPPVDSPNPEMETGVLLDCIKGILDIEYESTPPVWIEKYPLPNEKVNAEKIEELETRLKELSSEKARLEDEQYRIRKFKGLLYETGKRGLEPLVREAFRLIGFNVLNPEEYDEEYDLFIKESGLIIVGEVEATDNSFIDLIKYRQLLDYVEHVPAEDNECKGILIGNAFRGTDPAERGEQFSPHAIARCEKQGYCRITTYQLFKIIEKALLGITEEELREIRARIIACDKEFVLS